MRSKKGKALYVLLSTVFISVTLTTMTITANQTMLHVDPHSIVDPSLSPGQIFTINIVIVNVTDLFSFEFKLNFNSTILNALDVEVGDFLPPLEQVTLIEPPWINNTAGYIHFGAKITGCELPTSVSGTLSVITFQVMDRGESELTLHETHFTDHWNHPIPHETFDGYFNNIMSGKRDVEVTNVVPSHNIAYAGWLVEVVVTVKNKGDETETFDVNAYYDDNLIGTLTAADLPSNMQTNLTFTWNTEDARPCVNYTIKAEAKPVPNEINMTDNIFIDGVVKIRLLGDINGDGVVDIFDIVEAALAFGSYPGHPRWNPDADLKPDETIDIFDLVLIAHHDPQSAKAC